METTEALVARAANGDANAVDALLARNLPALLGFVRLRLGARLAAHEHASDIVQSTCREFLESIEDFEFRGEPEFRKWLFTAALRKILARARRRDAAAADADFGAVLEGYSSLCTPSRVAMAREEVARIESAFAALPEDWKEVVISARIFGFEHREIADRLGKSEGAVRVMLHRALARLAVTA